MQNPFLTLGISESSTREQIQSAYRRLVKTCHPDIQTTEEERSEAQERLIALNLAYEEALRRSDVAARVHSEYRTYSLADTTKLAAKLLSQRLYDSALRVLERCEERDEGWYFLHGQVLMRLNRPAQAYASFRRCVHFSPDNNAYRLAALKSYTAMNRQKSPVNRAASWLRDALGK
jgi:tetratricopeptide (TPR) repeat protein